MNLLIRADAAIPPYAVPERWFAEIDTLCMSHAFPDRRGEAREHLGLTLERFWRRINFMTSLSDALLGLLRRQLDAASGTVRLVLVSGAQGIGKSTALRDAAGRLGARVALLGIDDLYLTKADRQSLARSVHPLFETRGPPGTHDMPLLMETLVALRAAGPASRLSLPAFSKAEDDRMAQPRAWSGKPDLIILEGWLMGVLPDPAAASAPPLNRIEEQDPQGDWRRYQEVCLAGSYASLWDEADAFIHLDAPGFAAVRAWRLQQEAGNLGKPEASLTADETAWVETFILYYQRLTERLLAGKRREGEVLKVRRDRTVG